MLDDGNNVSTVMLQQSPPGFASEGPGRTKLLPDDGFAIEDRRVGKDSPERAALATDVAQWNFSSMVSATLLLMTNCTSLDAS